MFQADRIGGEQLVQDIDFPLSNLLTASDAEVQRISTISRGLVGVSGLPANTYRIRFSSFTSRR